MAAEGMMRRPHLGGQDTLRGLSPRLPRDSPFMTPDRASEAILRDRNSAHNSGDSAHAHLRKRTNAQRLLLSTCKAGALPTELRPHVLMIIKVSHKYRKTTCVTPILSVEIAQRSKSALFSPQGFGETGRPPRASPWGLDRSRSDRVTHSEQLLAVAPSRIASTPGAALVLGGPEHAGRRVVRG